MQFNHFFVDYTQLNVAIDRFSSFVVYTYFWFKQMVLSKIIQTSSWYFILCFQFLFIDWLEHEDLHAYEMTKRIYEEIRRIEFNVIPRASV